MLLPIEAVGIEHHLQSLALAITPLSARGSMRSKKRLDHAAEFPRGNEPRPQNAAARRDDERSARAGQFRSPLPAPSCRNNRPAETASGPAEQAGRRALLIDREVIHHGAPWRTEANAGAPFVSSSIIACRKILCLALVLRSKDEPHAAAGHAAEHPETPETHHRTSDASCGSGLRCSSYSPQGMIVCSGSKKLRVVGRPQEPEHRPRFRTSKHLVQLCPSPVCARPIPLALRSRYFSVTISRIGADILSHPTMHQHQAILDLPARIGRGIIVIENAMVRQKADHG